MPPFKKSPIALLVRERLNALSQKPVEEIANAAGYDKENMIRMFAEGETRVPFDVAVPLALALETDPGEFFRMSLSQYFPVPPGIRITYEASTEAPERQVDLNFKVPESLHRAFKLAATERGWTMRHLLERCFREFVERGASDHLE
jgi:hypothetical protein